MAVEQASLHAAIHQVFDSLHDLLDYVRIEFDERLANPRTLYADDLIQRVRNSNRALAGNIELVGVRSRLTFFSDERWVERILGNLVANAVRHSRATKVLIGARRRQGDIVFEIRDNGRGMSPSSVQRIPRAADQLSTGCLGRPETRQGFGLFVVQFFTDRLGGSVECSSVQGRGTVFRITLPGPLGTSETPHRVSSGDATKGARNKLIAVLDDDLTVLRATDHDPLRWLSVVTDMKRAPDLILLDYQLGDGDCLLHLELVKRKWNHKKRNVLVLTGTSQCSGLLNLSSVAPVLKKPLTDRKFEFILELLAGVRELPEAGFVEVADEY
jgi:anti-sigma regulatory factor (Ser/Thr protein kinase)